jgi:hypothetical protein
MIPLRWEYDRLGDLEEQSPDFHCLLESSSHYHTP